MTTVITPRQNTGISTGHRTLLRTTHLKNIQSQYITPTLLFIYVIIFQMIHIHKGDEQIIYY